MKKTFVLLLFFIAFLDTNAQQKYWIFLRDKDLNTKPQISEKAKMNRRILGFSERQFSDLPVNKNYVLQLQTLDIQPIIQSKWLNAISAKLTDLQIQEITKLSFVQNTQAIDGDLIITKTRLPKDEIWRTDFVMKQVGLEDFLSAGLSGKDVTIGVIDAGYYQADASEPLVHLFEQHKILGVHDYVNPLKTNHFEESETYSDFHGTEVLGAITGRDDHNKIQIGMATDANFYLARTDSGKKEFRGEEDNWVAAMEWMDSLGVRLINTSLGYTKGFTNPKENYKPEQMDGKTSVISKAAKIAADEKGILVVVSAGNEGDDRDWRIISTPADAEGVLAIGATNEEGLRIGYSSIGPEFLPYTKPNISCFSLYGTSLAAPVITGFAACLMQANPKLTNKELIELIEKSAHLYPFCNNYLGYGIPSAARALDLLNGKTIKQNQLIEVAAEKSQIDLQTPDNQQVTMFYKKDATHVLFQNSYKPKYKFITVKRNPAYPRTTVVTKEMVYELIWK